MGCTCKEFSEACEAPKGKVEASLLLGLLMFLFALAVVFGHLCGALVKAGVRRLTGVK